VLLPGDRYSSWNDTFIHVLAPPSDFGKIDGAHNFASATLLPSGSVLSTGGVGPIAGAELFEPANSALTGFGALAQPRSGHTATVLASSDILLTGGLERDGDGPLAELVDGTTLQSVSVGGYYGTHLQTYWTGWSKPSATLLDEAEGRVFFGDHVPYLYSP